MNWREFEHYVRRGYRLVSAGLPEPLPVMAGRFVGETQDNQLCFCPLSLAAIGAGESVEQLKARVTTTTADPTTWGPLPLTTCQISDLYGEFDKLAGTDTPSTMPLDEALENMKLSWAMCSLPMEEEKRQ